MATRKKILVIDDDPFWHRLLRRLFVEADYDIRTAASCKDGLRLAEQHKPDCILLDFHLGDGDAVDVCVALKNGAERPRFPVIVVSSDPDVEIMAYADCRADYFVLKGSHTMMVLPKVVSEVLGDGWRAVSWEPGH